jgi:cell division protein FtsX
MTETDYFENQKSSSVAIRVVAYIIAAFLTVGAMFAAANTMYAAVSSRGREIGTLRAVGFPRRTVLASFLLESLVLCSLGGLLGCLATLPLNGITRGHAERSHVQRNHFFVPLRSQRPYAGNGAGGSDGIDRGAVPSHSSHPFADYGRTWTKLI